MHQFCVDTTQACDPDDEDLNRIVAEAVVDYLRSHDYAGDAGERIGDILMGEIECAKDPNCGAGAPDNVYDWIRLNYVDHMHESQYEDTQKIRSDYYKALAEDISNMVAYTIPDKLMAELTDTPIEVVETPEWKQGAYDSVLGSFDKFDTTTFMGEVNQTQIDAIVRHFEMLLSEQHRDVHQLPENQTN